MLPRGDKIARIDAASLDESGIAANMQLLELRNSGEMAQTILHRALDVFARMGAVSAAQIIRDDRAIDGEFRAFVQRLLFDMRAEPRTVSTCLDYLLTPRRLSGSGTTR